MIVCSIGGYQSPSVIVFIAFGQKKYDNGQRGITPEILMPELWILCMALDPLTEFYQHMQFKKKGFESNAKSSK